MLYSRLHMNKSSQSIHFIQYRIYTRMFKECENLITWPRVTFWISYLLWLFAWNNFNKSVHLISYKFSNYYLLLHTQKMLHFHRWIYLWSLKILALCCYNFLHDACFCASVNLAWGNHLIIFYILLNLTWHIDQ